MIRKCICMLFPDGKPKAFTLSYDDGPEQDVRMIEIMNKYGVKGTFNLTGNYLTEIASITDAYLSVERAVALFKDSGHEVALHSQTHPYLDKNPQSRVCREILENRRNLEKWFGEIIRGMAYPQGTMSDGVAECLRLCGVAYARTTVQTESFGIPEDWLYLNPTCHHYNARIPELTETFLNGTPVLEPWLFYIWGHSYEFAMNDNWEVFESICEKLGGKEDVWYATNIEIYDYVQAYKRLIYGADANMVYNPSAIPVWIKYNDKPVKVGVGEQVTLEEDPEC